MEPQSCFDFYFPDNYELWTFLFYWLFSLFTFQMLSSFTISPPQTPSLIPHNPCLYEGAPQPTCPISPQCPSIANTGSLSLHRTKGLPSHWCQIRSSFTTYAAGAMGPLHVYSLVGGLVPGSFGGYGWLIVVLPMGFQIPSAPSVLLLTPPLGSPWSV